MDSAPRRPVPVFPLPNVVLFPRAILPLHVYEMRYRALVRDALAGDRMIAMALLKPGWERDYFGNPEFYALGCLGRCEQVEWQPDDCYNLKLVGLSRVRLGRLEREFPYRAARVELAPEAPCSEDDPLVQSEHQALVESWRRLARSEGAAGLAAVPQEWTRGYAALVNTLAMLLAIAPAEKQALLEMDSLIERGRRVRGWVELQAGGGGEGHPGRPDN
jgi:Lon protease-like protein